MSSCSAECLFTLPAWQIQNVATACEHDDAGERGSCCASALLALRTGATQSGAAAFVISKEQGDACIQQLKDSLRGQDKALAELLKCGITDTTIFHQTTTGCNNVLTVGGFIRDITSRGMSLPATTGACKDGADFSCDKCKSAVANATSAIAAPAGDPDTLRNCQDLVFMALASASSAAEATVFGGCLYSLPGR